MDDCGVQFPPELLSAADAPAVEPVHKAAARREATAFHRGCNRFVSDVVSRLTFNGPLYTGIFTVSNSSHLKIYFK